MTRFILSLVIAACCSTAAARMYQWVDPDTGTTQLSGKPPAWYRSGGGPRVFVFENGQIVDDTGVTVQEPERNRLRQQAFLQAEEDKNTAKEKLLEAKKLEAALGLEQKDEENEVATKEPAPTIEEPPKVDAPPTEQDTVNKMRSLIEEWEAQRTESAKGVVNPATD